MKRFLFLAVSIASLFGLIDSPSFWKMSGIALAKPPPWAPAHGYRRKHGGDHDRDDEDDDRREERRTVEDRRVYEVSRYEEYFRRLDVNRDGIISRSEWNEGLDLFDRLDRNHDGVLSRSELDRVDEERGLISGLLFKIKEKVASFWDRLW